MSPTDVSDTAGLLTIFRWIFALPTLIVVILPSLIFGASRQFVHVVLTSPTVIFVNLVMLYFILSRSCSTILQSLRLSAAVTCLGLLPIVAFSLVVASMESTKGSVEALRIVNIYEKAILSLHSHLEALPFSGIVSFLISQALLLVLLSQRRLRLVTGYRRVTSGVNLLAAVVTIATSFTYFSTFSIGDWHPSPIRRLEAEIAPEVNRAIIQEILIEADDEAAVELHSIYSGALGRMADFEFPPGMTVLDQQEIFLEEHGRSLGSSLASRAAGAAFDHSNTPESADVSDAAIAAAARELRENTTGKAREEIISDVMTRLAKVSSENAIADEFINGLVSGFSATIASHVVGASAATMLAWMESLRSGLWSLRDRAPSLFAEANQVMLSEATLAAVHRRFDPVDPIIPGPRR